MNWIYPEEGKVWEEGEEIVAEVEILVDCLFEFNKEERLQLGMRVEDGKWWFAQHSYLGMEEVRIIAYIPYVKPEPPEKPQDCPFCGNEMMLFSDGFPPWYQYRCSADVTCRWVGPPKKSTKAEAIKVLNSVSVEKK